MVLKGLLWGVAALLATGVLALAAARRPARGILVYGLSLAVALAMLVAATASLLAPASLGATSTLPLGLPWLGAHFRLDALSAFFLVVINLGAAAASLFGLGYGRHEETPERVLPFYPAFLAGMNLVLLAADAFTFLFSWEFMSLSSWALVMAHHRRPGNAAAGYLYLLMASFGTLALLLAFGLLAWWQAVIVLVVLLFLQAIEIAVVRPYVDRRTVRVGPTIPIIVGLLGFELYGVGGSIYAIALGVIVLAALDAIGRQREQPA